MPEIGRITAARLTKLDADGNPTGIGYVFKADEGGTLVLEYWVAPGTYARIGGPPPSWAGPWSADEVTDGD